MSSAIRSCRQSRSSGPPSSSCVTNSWRLLTQMRGSRPCPSGWRNAMRRRRLAPDYLRATMQRMLADPGGMRLTDLVDQELPVSYKHFIEVFRRHVGPTPKGMQRILRFAQVFAMIQSEEKVNWARAECRARLLGSGPLHPRVSPVLRLPACRVSGSGPRAIELLSR